MMPGTGDIKVDDIIVRRLRARISIRKEEISKSIYNIVRDTIVNEVDDNGSVPLNDVVDMIISRLNKEIGLIFDKISSDIGEVLSDFEKYTLPKITEAQVKSKEASELIKAYEEELIGVKKKLKEICTSNKNKEIYTTLSIIEEASKRNEEPLTYSKIVALSGKSEGTVKAHIKKLEKLGYVRVIKNTKPYQIIFICAPWS